MNTTEALSVVATALVLAMVPLTPKGQSPEPPIEPELIGTWYRDYWMGVCVATQTDDAVAKLVQLARADNQLKAKRKMEITEVKDKSGRVEQLHLQDGIIDRTFYRDESACVADATMKELQHNAAVPP